MDIWQLYNINQLKKMLEDTRKNYASCTDTIDLLKEKIEEREILIEKILLGD